MHVYQTKNYAPKKYIWHYSQVKDPRKNSTNIKVMALRNVMWGKCKIHIAGGMQEACRRQKIMTQDWEELSSASRTKTKNEEINICREHGWWSRGVWSSDFQTVQVWRLLSNMYTVSECGEKDIHIWYWWIYTLIQYFGRAVW